MVSLSAIRAANTQLKTLANPTIAVFVGATSGIGRSTLLELAQRKTTGLKVYIVGRNTNRLQPLLEQLRALNPKGEFILLEAQVSELSDVRRICDEIKSKEKSLDLLWLSPGAIPFGGRRGKFHPDTPAWYMQLKLTCSPETSDGLSTHMSLAYWSRMLFTTLLLGLLKASSANPRVVSILNGGGERADLSLDDLDVKTATTENAYVEKYAAASITMNTLYLERLAEQNPAVVFIHKYPGLVPTGFFNQGWEKWTIKRVLFAYIVPTVVKFTGVSEAEVGERGVYALFSAQYGGKGIASDGEKPLRNSKGGIAHEGVFCVKADDEIASNDKILNSLRNRGAPERVWDETNQILEPFV